MKNKIICLVLSIFMFFGLTSCNKNEKIEVSMYLWDKSMTSELTPWLEEKFPEIDFNFVIGHNSIEYFKDLKTSDGLSIKENLEQWISYSLQSPLKTDGL